jgi:uncharacterized membrane protein YidH (DUF202 family)
MDCEIMDEKQVMKSVFNIYSGIWLFFLIVFFMTLNNNLFFLNITNNIILILCASILPIFLVWELRKLKKNGIKINRKTFKNVKTIPMLAGFILMVIGIYFASISLQLFYPDGSRLSFFYHPFSGQSLVIFLVGSGIQLLEFVWYYDTVSSKIMEKTKQTPSLNIL